MAEGGPVTFNPLFLYGGVGLGKTHLMHAIAHELQARNPELRVLYLSAEQFMYRFVQALRERQIMGFKELFRSVDVLMVDDVQFIAGKGVKEYISETGGTAATADSGRTFLVLPNGTAQPVRNSGRGIVVPPGSTIIVPKDIDPLFKLDVAANVAGILGNLITSVATIALLAK